MNEIGASFQTTLVNLRERLLSFLLKISSSDVLNAESTPVSAKTRDTFQVVEKLTRAANLLKAEAIDESGEHIDYQRLAGSQVYDHYRRECTSSLRTFDPSTLNTRDQKLAFWINLYNTLVIDAVIRFGIQRSVAEGTFGIMRFFRHAAYQVDGFRMSNEDIEHGVLRGNRGNPYLPGPQFGSGDPRTDWVIHPVEARIHFALNCASLSCPPIGVYTPEKIDEQLDLAARNFLSQEVWVEDETLHLSQIFNWYKRDFGGERGVVNFIAHNHPAKGVRDWLAKLEGVPSLRYTKYDWNLNIAT